MTGYLIKKGEIKEDRFKRYRKKPFVVEAYQTDEEVEIVTLEGTMKADVGDWIIKGVNEELYPCKPDIFNKTYRKVETNNNKKRFCKEWNGVFDRLHWDDVYDVVGTMNQLHEKNLRLIDEYSYFHKQMMKLEKENENLKQALWEAEARYYAERSEYDFEYEEWIEELKEDWDREYWND